MAPTITVARVLARTGIRPQDFDLIEIHEAFAAQVLGLYKRIVQGLEAVGKSPASVDLDDLAALAARGESLLRAQLFD